MNEKVQNSSFRKRSASDDFNDLVKRAMEPRIGAAIGDIDADFQIELENWLANEKNQGYLKRIMSGSNKELGIVSRVVPYEDGSADVNYINQYG